MASKNSTAAPIQRASKPTSKAAGQKKAPAGLGNPIRRTSSGHAGIAIAGDAAAAPPTGRTGADADVNGNSESVTVNGESVTAVNAPPAAAPATLVDELDDITSRLFTAQGVLNEINTSDRGCAAFLAMDTLNAGLQRLDALLTRVRDMAEAPGGAA